MKKEMNILFATDTHYAMPMTVSITSIFENNRSANIHVYILYSTLEYIQKKNLEELAKSYGQNIHLVHVEESYFETAPTFRWSKETYYRLLINEKLPLHLDRILYLDCDIIVNNGLEDLYSTDLTEYHIAALKEQNATGPRTRLGLDPKGEYFQAGVLLINIQKCRQLLTYEKVLSVLKDLGERLKVVDQDVLNVIFDGKIVPLNVKFNNDKITNFNGSGLSRFLNRRDQKSIESTSIFHYSTGKPWNNLYSGSCEEIWYKYLIVSPYRELYQNKYNTFKYHLLRTGLMKTLFYEYIHLTPFINTFAARIFPQETYQRLKNYYRRSIK